MNIWNVDYDYEFRFTQLSADHPVASFTVHTKSCRLKLSVRDENSASWISFKDNFYSKYRMYICVHLNNTSEKTCSAIWHELTSGANFDSDESKKLSYLLGEMFESGESKTKFVDLGSLFHSKFFIVQKGQYGKNEYYIKLDDSKSSPNYPITYVDVIIPSPINQEVKRNSDGNYEFEPMKIIEPSPPSIKINTRYGVIGEECLRWLKNNEITINERDKIDGGENCLKFWNLFCKHTTFTTKDCDSTARHICELLKNRVL